MFGKLTPAEIEELIKKEFIGRIGCHADNTTYVVPISYAYDGEYIYGHTHEGLKLRLIRKNPHICFQVDNMHDMANWQSAVAWGDFEELGEGKQRETAIRVLKERALPFIHSETMQLSPQWPFPTADDEGITGIIFRIKLTEKTGRYEKSNAEYFFAT